MALRPSKLILHSRTISDCSARVRIAASLKNIPLKIVEHRPGAGEKNISKDENYKKMNPNATLPTLEAHYETGEPLILKQSLSMLDFLEETYPETTRLIPPVTDIAARCQVRDLALFVACDFQPLQATRAFHALNVSLASGDESADKKYGTITDKKYRAVWTAHLLGRSMRVYEAMAAQSAGNFSVGDNVSIADVCLVAMIQTVNRARKTFNDEMGYPTISRIMKSCEGMDAFRLQGVPSRSVEPGPPRDGPTDEAPQAAKPSPSPPVDET